MFLGKIMETITVIYYNIHNHSIWISFWLTDAKAIGALFKREFA